MSGPAMGSFAMGHRGITTTGLYIVDKRPRGLTGLLSVITALLTVRISTSTHIVKQPYFACAGKAHLQKFFLSLQSSILQMCTGYYMLLIAK